MNDDQLDDLKQFFDSKLSQSEQRIKSELKTEIAALDQKIEDLDAKVDTIADTLNETLQNQEARFTKLEAA